MPYTTGMMNQRVCILSLPESTDGEWGREQADWQELRTVWAAVDWSRGVKSMREGAMDAYDSIMVRTRYHQDIKRECRLRYDGKVYQIDSLHASREQNTIQITATELVNPQ